MKMADPHIDFLRDVMGSRCTSADPIGGGGIKGDNRGSNKNVIITMITTGWTF